MNIHIKRIVSTILLSSVLTYTLPIWAYTNSEEVFSRLDTNGNVINQVITEKENDEINQIDSNEELPVNCKITYYLNGNEISAEEICGKSGKVKIELEYTNLAVQKVTVNGKNVEMYTPFVILTGTIIDTENNSNIEISNGKIIEQNGKAIAVGYALPGMNENLDVKNNKNFDIDIPSKVEISFDTTNFEMGNIISYATPKLFSEIDVDFSEIKNKLNQVDDLKDASIKILDGAVKLKDGIVELNNGVNTLKDGSIKIDSGVNDLQAGTGKLSQGANTLSAGTKEYNKNIGEFNSAINTYTAGVSTLGSSYSGIDDGINTLNAKVGELSQGSETLKIGISTLNAQVPGLVSKFSELGQAITAEENYENQIIAEIQNIKESTAKEVKTTKTISVTATAVATVDNTDARNKIQDSINVVSANQTLSEEEKASIIQNLQMALASVKDSETATQTESNSENVEVEAVISADTTKLEALAGTLSAITNKEKVGMQTTSAALANENGLVNGITALKNGADALDNGVKVMQAGIGDLANGSNQFRAGLNTINSSNSALTGASLKITAAASTISTGADTLANGTKDLLKGVNTLKDGTSSLVSGVDTLKDGLNRLMDGSQELSDGIKKFNDEGVNKIVNLANDVRPILNRVEKLEWLSDNYKGFNGKDYDEISFISIINSIKNSAKEKENSEIALNENDIKESK